MGERNTDGVGEGGVLKISAFFGGMWMWKQASFIFWIPTTDCIALEGLIFFFLLCHKKGLYTILTTYPSIIYYVGFILDGQRVRASKGWEERKRGEERSAQKALYTYQRRFWTWSPAQMYYRMYIISLTLSYNHHRWRMNGLVDKVGWRLM